METVFKEIKKILKENNFDYDIIILNRRNAIITISTEEGNIELLSNAVANIQTNSDREYFIELEEMQTLLLCLEHIKNNVEFSIKVPNIESEQ